MSVTIDLSPDGTRIFLRSTRPTPGLGGVVVGSRFSTTGGAHWSIPLTMNACRALREKFGATMRVGAALADWAREAIALEREMSALGEAADATLERVPLVSPVLAGAMASRTYQRAGARFVARAATVGGVLVADEPGLGKTLEAIGGVIESGVPGPYLVVCPKTAVLSVWAREIPRWWPTQSVVTVPDGRAKRDEILWRFLYGPEVYDGQDVRQTEEAMERYAPTLKSSWFIAHAEMLRCRSYWRCGYVETDVAGTKALCGVETKWKAGPKKLDCDHDGVWGEKHDDFLFPQLFGIHWGAVIVDESDRALLRPTGTPNMVRRGMELISTREGGLRIAMSGTPFRSRPRLLWGTLNWLRPKEYGGFWRWAETYYEVGTGWGGSRTLGVLREDKAKDLDFELRQIMIRRTKAEVAPDLPAKTYGGAPLDPADATSPVGVWIDMGPEQRKLYDQMADQSAVALEGGTLNAIGVLAEMTRLKQFATAAGRMNGTEFAPKLPSAKFDWLLEHLEELGYPDDPQGKVVIVSQFTAVLRMFDAELRSRFGRDRNWQRFGAASLTGAITGPQRAETIDRFNGEVGSPTEHLLFMQIKTGGVAITLDTADQMVFLDETWVPDDHIQAEDRIHRVSRPRPVTYWYLRSLGTVEEGIARVGEERRVTSHNILDGRRGIAYARQILAATR